MITEALTERRGEYGGGGAAHPSQETANDDTRYVDERGGPGILLLSSDTRLLHMNRKGWELVQQINDAKPVKSGGLMPTAVIQICAEVQRLVKDEVGLKEWEQVEIRRIAGPGDSPVLLRGFGLPAGAKPQEVRVLILIEPIGRRAQVAEQAKERFQLTTREQSVVQNLARGWTNKEIASALGITEPTVKAHIKHIMEKTKCTTRTGILAQILQM
jgi:DNA-binding CsgD family transcriptional regulator